MKMCVRCGERPVANIHGRYCLECREIAKAEAEARRKEMQPVRDAVRREKKKRQERIDDAHKRMGTYKPLEKREGCPGCFYYRHCYAGVFACHYLIDTGKQRPVPAEECYQHEGTPYTPVNTEE